MMDIRKLMINDNIISGISDTETDKIILYLI